MRYSSTRGRDVGRSFDDVLIGGLATDGGLYVPDEVPDLSSIYRDVVARPDTDYAAVAARVMAPFVAGSAAEDSLEAICKGAYDTFDHPEVVPVRHLADQHWLAELFWGPTFAFKDLALQVVGRLFDAVLAARGERVTIVGATSGDTGSAAIEACRDRSAIDIVILHPHGRVSDVQRRQMTTVDAPNVTNLAVDGTFDDCQDLVKAMFADEAFRHEVNLSAVNSINWARIMAQVVYYLTSAARVGAGQPVSFTVPTGNFGNIYAGDIARRAGVPIRRLVMASNTNDILTRTLESGVMAAHGVTPTLSPSMDIQISSNFERLLFDLMGRDGQSVADLMATFRDTGRVALPADVVGPLTETFAGHRANDDATTATIAAWADRAGVVVDPHTAVGLAAAEATAGAEPMITLATAHPAKFADAVRAATGADPAMPDRLAALADLPERCDRVANDVAAVQDRVRAATMGQ